MFFGLYHGLCLLPVLLCLFGPVSDNMDHQTEGQNKVKPQEDVHELPRSIDDVTPHPVTILQNANYDKVGVLNGSWGLGCRLNILFYQDKKPDILENIHWTP